MISFLTGIVVTLVTFYIAFIYASTVIGLLGFAEAVLTLFKASGSCRGTDSDYGC